MVGGVGVGAAVGLDGFVGRYSGETRWRSSDGDAGSFDGSIALERSGHEVMVRFGDGHVVSGELAEMDAAQVELRGESEGVSSEGTLLILDGWLMLEYVADVGGRVERNTDAWTLRGDVLARAGLIRQDERTIWFESEFSREASR